VNHPIAAPAARLGILLALALACAVMLAMPAARGATAPGQESFDNWPLLVNPFESTGGGGIMIGGYQPVVSGRTCTTNFTATTPDGKVFRNTVEFDAIEMQGGILCNNGRWRALDGSATGTTPFRVFIKDGVTRRAP